MKTRLVIAIAVVGTVLLAAALGLARGLQATGSALQHQVSGSGIQGRILFLDSGSPETGLVVSGTATGLTPGQQYFTLVYDAASLPAGPTACVPSASSTLTGDQMVVGFWHNNNDGTGTLCAIKKGPPGSRPATYVPLSDIASVSIRHVVGPPPAGFILQACGEIESNP